MNGPEGFFFFFFFFFFDGKRCGEWVERLPIDRTRTRPVLRFLLFDDDDDK